MTPLHRAVFAPIPLYVEEANLAAVKRNSKIVELLIDKGADVNAKDIVGGTPLHNAVRTPLYSAVRALNSKIVELLIDKGADVNAKRDDGETPLHSAAHVGNKEMAELLIANGADVNVNVDYGTPLHLAAKGGFKETLELLITNGADVNVMSAIEKNLGGNTPLDNALIGSHHEIADLLRKHGGKTGKELKDGEPVAEVAKTESSTGNGTDYSGKYILSIAELDAETNFELKPDGSLHGKNSMEAGNDLIGSWKVEGELLICEGTTEKSSQGVIYKFNKKTGKVESISVDGIETLIKGQIPEGEDGLYFKKN